MAHQQLEKSVHDAFATWTDAWNNGDIEGYLAAYASSEMTRYISNGKVIQGHSAILEHYRHRFDNGAAMGDLNVTQLDIDVIDNHNAILIGVIEFTSGEIVINGAFTLHIRLIDDNWYIITDHTSSA